MAKKTKAVKRNSKVLTYDLEAMKQEFPDEYAMIARKKPRKAKA